MWRCDPGRSGSTREELPAKLHRQWTLRLPPLEPAWPDEPRMRFDAAYQPIVVGGSMVVASSHDDAVRAFDLRDGSERWRFYADGPVRFAPAAWQDRLYVASDDGRLYCLDAATGQARWKLLGGPSDRKVLGNERLISMWPARGGPVVAPDPSAQSGQAVYFAAGIWPFMGVFLYAVDADSGQVLWCNDGAGSTYTLQPHNSAAFAGIAPQGYLATAGDKLLVPNGRAAAAGFDRPTGKLLYFHHAVHKRTGHCQVAAAGEHFLNSGALCDLETGEPTIPVWPEGENVGLRSFQSAFVFYDRITGEEIAPLGAIGVLSGTTYYQSAGDFLYACDLSRPVYRTYIDLRGRRRKGNCPRLLWKLPMRARPMLRAGRRLYAAGEAEVLALDLPDGEEVDRFLDQTPPDGDALLPPPQIAWGQGIDETAANMIAAAGRLLLVTYEGSIHCWGGEAPPEPPERPAGPPDGAARTHADAAAAQAILRATGAAEGYCLVLGLKDGRLAEELARQSSLRVVAVDADAAKVDAFRRRLDRARLPGGRLSAVVAEPRSALLPPYLASLIVSEDVSALGPPGEMPVERLFRTLRPYGGVLCLELGDGARRALGKLVAAAKPAGAELGEREGLTLLRRRGPLDGAGSWTHQYGNAANTCVSEDSLVRAPLGLLWFGGPSNEAVLPRHGHGPPEQVIGGRLFIEGPHILRALDVYTGRLLWQRRLQDLGEHYNYTTHEPGANALGTNFVATRDAVYVAHSRQCLLLDPATGRTARRLILPGGDAQADHAPQWGYLGVWEDLLVAGSTPMKFHTPDLAGGDFSRTIRTTDWRTAFYYTGSRLRALCEEIERWRDFEIERPSAVLQPPPEIEPAREAQPRAAADVDFIVANVNKLIRQQDVLSKLPADVVAGARKRDAREAARWQEASRLDDYYDKPKPDTIDDLQALLGELRASGGTTLEDGRDAHVLRRQILEHCYPYLPRWRRLKVGQRTLDYTASSEVVVMDRRTGKVLWTRRAAAAFRHNAICLGGGKLFCIDRLPTPVAHRLLRRGVKTHRLNHLLAIDIRTGKVLWSTQENAFGTWLSYSAEHDVLLQGGRPSRDMLADETGRRLMALRGASGEVLWDKKAPRTAAGLSSQTDDEDEDDNDEYLWDYQDEDDLPYSGPCMLHGRTIITQSKAFDLLTGEPKMHKHPLTGEPIHWRFRRNYGCNTVIASRHLLTFRSAAAGFFDLAGDGGTGNLGGFKSGCTSNLVVADGVLNAPDYTRTCTCSYQNQSSLALIHMPEADLWTFQDFDRGQQPIRSLGVNFGAPGDRRAANGVLWLEYPFVGGRTPDVDIETDVGGEIDVDRKTLEGLCFRRHASRIRGGGAGGLAWVAASGLEAAAHISVKVASRRAPARAYTVSLHFAEPAWAKKGQRIFDVALMGRTVLKGFDVAAEAGAPLTPVVKTFRKVAVGDKLRIALTPAAGSTLPPVLCGVEIVAEP